MLNDCGKRKATESDSITPSKGIVADLPVYTFWALFFFDIKLLLM